MIATLRALLAWLRPGRFRETAPDFTRALEEALDRDPVSLRVESLERLLRDGAPHGAGALAASLGSTDAAVFGGSNGGTDHAPL